jgi:hypothetical protein
VSDGELDEAEEAFFPTMALSLIDESEMKEHESSESFREEGCPESFYSGTLAKDLKDREPPESFMEYGQSELQKHDSPESRREGGCPESFCSGTLAKHAGVAGALHVLGVSGGDCCGSRWGPSKPRGLVGSSTRPAISEAMAAQAGDHLGELLCDVAAAAAAAIGSVPDRESSESIGESFALLAVRDHGRSELKEHEPPESFREMGCPESFYSGTLAMHAVRECGKCELKERDLQESYGQAVAQHADGEFGQSELKNREPPESFRDVGSPESCGHCELEQSDSPKSHGKAGAQHAVREHGQSELKDREPPESLRALGCPESFCSGPLSKHAVEEHGHSELLSVLLMFIPVMLSVLWMFILRMCGPRKSRRWVFPYCIATKTACSQRAREAAAATRVKPNATILSGFVHEFRHHAVPSTTSPTAGSAELLDGLSAGVKVALMRLSPIS